MPGDNRRETSLLAVHEVADGFGDLGKDGHLRAGLLQRRDELLQPEIAHSERAAGDGKAADFLRGFLDQSEAHKCKDV